MEFVFTGDTERILGVTPENAVESALMQAKTISEHVEALRNLGTYPELDDPVERVRVKREMRNALQLSIWHDWIIIYADNSTQLHFFERPVEILDLLHHNRAIRSVIPEVTYETMMDQIDPAE